MEYEWDENKAAANLSKHGVSFNEAKTVFEDTFCAVFDDPIHSLFEEDRSIIIGESSRKRTLIVAFTERDNVFRLISARKATRKEIKDYEEG